MNEELKVLKEKVKSEDWDTCRLAVGRLAEINSEEATGILLDMLRSNDTQVRNLAAVAMRDTKDQKYFGALIERINQLGVKGQVETLAYALEYLNCSRNLYDIANLNLNAGTNREVKHSTTVILNEQSFLITSPELNAINELLDKFNYTIEGFDVKYSVID
jgi:HEAT repeat protein